MRNTERFTKRVENYILYRPHYPKEIISILKDKIGLSRHWTIADIGSGTGISSELFLQNGNRVYGVEPNQEMRKAAEVLFKNDSNFISINATAEVSSLQNSIIDLIVVGQALHWFDIAAVKKEFQRIANPGAYLLLMWNVREIESDFQQAYEDMLLEFALDYDETRHHNVDESMVRDLFHPQLFTFQSLHNSQCFDLDGLKGRLLSCSYIPLEGDVRYKPMMRRLREIFEAYSIDSKIEIAYSCDLYYGKIE